MTYTFNNHTARKSGRNLLLRWGKFNEVNYLIDSHLETVFLTNQHNKLTVCRQTNVLFILQSPFDDVAIYWIWKKSTNKFEHKCMSHLENADQWQK